MVVEQGNALARSITERETALAHAREMEKVTEMKSQFISHVTHELRSPVNAVIGLAELMQHALDHQALDRLADHLALMQSSAANLRSIITNILDLSKIEAGRMDIFVEEFDLSTLVKEVGDITRVLLGGKPVEIRVIFRADSSQIATDRVKLRQILTNLCSNAAKFTDRGKISMTVEREEGGWRIAVRDTGVGIRDGDLQRLFTAFSQLEEAKTRRYEGTGLGLVITRQLATLLGGTISVASTYGEGSVFTLRLPCKPPASKESAA